MTPDLTGSYSEAVGYKVNEQKPIFSRCTSDAKVGFEIEDTVPFTLAPPKV